MTATWGIAGVIAGFAGFVLAETIGTFNPSLGFGYLLITLTAAVAGGLGRPYGTLVGALLVGLVLELAGAYFNSSYKLAFALGVLVLLLLFRPNGLLVSRRQASRRCDLLDLDPHRGVHLLDHGPGAERHLGLGAVTSTSPSTATWRSACISRSR